MIDLRTFARDEHFEESHSPKASVQNMIDSLLFLETVNAGVTFVGERC